MNLSDWADGCWVMGMVEVLDAKFSQPLDEAQLPESLELSECWFQIHGFNHEIAASRVWASAGCDSGKNLVFRLTMCPLWTFLPSSFFRYSSYLFLH